MNYSLPYEIICKDGARAPYLLCVIDAKDEKDAVDKYWRGYKHRHGPYDRKYLSARLKETVYYCDCSWTAPSGYTRTRENRCPLCGERLRSR